MKGECCVHVIHVNCLSEKGCFFLRCQISFFQQKYMPDIFVAYQLAYFSSCRTVICLFYAGKAEKEDRIGSLQCSVVLMFPDIQSLKQFSPAIIVYRKEYLRHTHV